MAAEIADILIFSMLFAHETGIDIEKAILDKIRHNETRYPVEKAIPRKHDFCKIISIIPARQ